MNKIIYICVFVALIAANECSPVVTVLDSVGAVHFPVVISLWAVLETFLAHYIAKILADPALADSPELKHILAMFFGFSFTLYGGGFAIVIFILAVVLFSHRRFEGFNFV